jgi:hypothetical protein
MELVAETKAKTLAHSKNLKRRYQHDCKHEMRVLRKYRQTMRVAVRLMKKEKVPGRGVRIHVTFRI